MNNHIYEFKKIYIDKLFPKLNGVTLSNLKIDPESVSYITTPHEAKRIADIIAKHAGHHKDVKASVLVDATGGVGGDTITLSTQFGSVISIEIDTDRYSLLKHNVNEYKSTNVTTINGDSLIIIPKLSDVDVIYADPPWGGKDYKIKENLRLTLGSTEIEKFILDCFNPEIMATIPKLIALKMPKNYDLKYMYEKITHSFDIYLYQLKKIGLQ
jgi:16S rRNA G966 N2-methylase RsmD